MLVALPFLATLPQGKAAFQGGGWRWSGGAGGKGRTGAGLGHTGKGWAEPSEEGDGTRGRLPCKTEGRQSSRSKAPGRAGWQQQDALGSTVHTGAGTEHQRLKLECICSSVYGHY